MVVPATKNLTLFQGSRFLDSITVPATALPNGMDLTGFSATFKLTTGFRGQPGTVDFIDGVATITDPINRIIQLEIPTASMAMLEAATQGRYDVEVQDASAEQYRVYEGFWRMRLEAKA